MTELHKSVIECLGYHQNLRIFPIPGSKTTYCFIFYRHDLRQSTNLFCPERDGF